jgi:hypothetical protein
LSKNAISKLQNPTNAGERNKEYLLMEGRNTVYSEACFSRRETSFKDVQLSINSGRYSEEVMNVQM